jgi:hypothetical protein
MRAIGCSVAIAVILAAGLAAAQSPGTDPVGLRGDVGGLWFDPGAAGQGLQLDVLDGGRAAVTWYTYDAEGEPLWLFGLGRVRGAVIEAEVSSARGGRFITDAEQPAPEFSPRGQLRIEFSDCARAQLIYTDAASGLADGQRALQRLSAPQGARCNAEEEFAEQRTLGFELGANGFSELFADLPAQGQDIYELDFAWEVLPAPLDSRRGLRLTGHNRSDDLAMLIKAPLGGLLPEHDYALELEVEIATQVPAGCAGIGGSPGEGVYVKLGALGSEPGTDTVLEGGVPTLRPNFDFGQQSQGGSAALLVGTLSNSQDCENGPDGEWELKTLSTAGQPFRARSDAEGRLWVLAGTDSGFEGLTNVYYTALRVRLRALSEDG